MDTAKYWYLENLNVFRELPQNLLEEVSEKTKMFELHNHEFIYFPGDPSLNLYIINKGKVKVASFSDEGKEVIKTLLQPGEIFGELALFDEKRRSDFAQAVEPVKVCKINKADFEALMARDNHFSLKINKLIGFRLKQIEKRLESLVFKEAPTRIIELLVDLAEAEGEKVGVEIKIENKLTQQDMANLLATSRQTVTSVLNDLKARNLIHFDRRQILIRDLAKLKAALTNQV